VLEDPFDFVTRQDHRQLGGLFGADDVVEPAEVLVEDFFIQKHEGTQRLTPIDGKAAEPLQ